MASIFSLSLILLSLSSFTSIKTRAQGIKSARLLDFVLRDYTLLHAYTKKSFKTGEIHNIHLPSNLSGIEVKTAKFRCGSLQRYGAKIGKFSLNSGLKVQPCPERIILITHKLGFNWSSIYYDNYDLTGYGFISPVLGLKAYNFGKVKNKMGSDPFEVEIFGIEKKQILVDFGKMELRKSKMGLIPLCASFGNDGKVVMKNMVAINTCEIKGSGHVAMVVESPLMPERRRESGVKMAIGVSIGAALGAFLLGLLLVALFVKGKKKKALMEELERRAYEEEAFQVINVGNVRATT